MSRSVVQLNCYTKHHRNTSLTNLHCELKEPVPKKHKNAYNALWNGATGRFILSCFVGDVAVLRKLARLNKKIPRNYDSKRKFVGFLELLTWFEQATCSLRVSCSTSWATVAHCTYSATDNILPYFSMSVKDGFSAGERHRIKHGMEYAPVSWNPYNKKATPCAAIRLHKE